MEIKLMSALHSHAETAKPIVFGFYGWRDCSTLIEAVPNYCVAHVLADLGVWHHLYVCPMPLHGWWRDRGTPYAGLWSQAVRRIEEP